MTEKSLCSKPLYQSKTLWVNLLLAVFAMLLPSAQKFMVESPEVVAMAFAGINVLLRRVSSGKVYLWSDSEKKK